LIAPRATARRDRTSKVAFEPPPQRCPHRGWSKGRRSQRL